MDAVEDLGSLQVELERGKPNLFRIQQLCQRQPGLIGDDMELRRKVWTLLLLPRSGAFAPPAFVASQSNPQLRLTTSASIGELSPDMPTISVEESCMEQQVLEADVGRTRSEINEFRTPLWRESLQEALRSFCLEHRVQYKQGMNELMAVFMHVSPPASGSSLSLRLFSAFLYKYLERFFYRDESSFLFKAFRLFHLLMMYIDPKLGLHLFECAILPELYAAPWLLTAFARSTPLNAVLRLWDILITVDDPAFLFFVALALLRTMRKELIRCEGNFIPEIIAKLRIVDFQMIDKLIAESFFFYRLVPRCFLRALRVCCVSSASAIAGANPLHSGGALLGSGQGAEAAEADKMPSSPARWSRHDDAMAKQAVRCCVMMNPSEMAHKIIEQWNDNLNGSIYSRAEMDSSSKNIAAAFYLNGGYSAEVLKRIQEISYKNLGKDSLTRFEDARRTVILDIRLSDDIRGEDGGFIVGSLRMDPNLIGHPEQMDSWLGQLESLSGHNICILDNISSSNSGLTLWRRLLLGEGDGDLMGAKNDYIAIHQSIFSRDSDSPFFRIETEIIEEDAQRMGTHVAVALIKKGFSFVSLLDGSFNDLRSAIVSVRGSATGIVRKLQPSGLLSHQAASLPDIIVGADPVMMSLMVGEQTANAMTTSSSSSSVGDSDTQFTNSDTKKRERSSSDKAALQRTLKALSIAKLLGHYHMAELLQRRVESFDE